jgi:hypothetical protein
VKQETDPRDYDAVVVGVKEDGRLTVRSLADGKVNHLSGEEVSIRPH